MFLHTQGKLTKKMGIWVLHLHILQIHLDFRKKNTEATFIASTKMQRVLLDIVWDSTRTRVPPQTAEVVLLRMSCSSFSFLSFSVPSLT